MKGGGGCEVDLSCCNESAFACLTGIIVALMKMFEEFQIMGSQAPFGVQ